MLNRIMLKMKELAL